MSSVIGESYKRSYTDKMRVYSQRPEPEDMVKLYNTPKSADILSVYKTSSPIEQYRCPATTPVCHFTRRERSGLSGHRNVFLTQAYGDDTMKETNGRHVFGYYFMATGSGDKNLQQDTQNTWLDNLCARPVDEIVSKSLVQLPAVKSRHYWPHTRPTQGEKYLVRAWEQNSGRSTNRNSPGHKLWTHPGRCNVSDSAFPDYLTSAGTTVTRYAGHVYRLSLENKDSGDEDDDNRRDDADNQIAGPVVVSCTIQELPSRSARSRLGDTPKSTIHLPKLKKRKKKRKEKETAGIVNTPVTSVGDVDDITPSVEVTMNTNVNFGAPIELARYKTSSIINILRPTDDED